MVFLETSNMLIDWNEALQAVVVTRKGYSDGESFRDEHIKFIELLELKKSRKLITDLRQMRMVSREDQEWMVSYLTPRAIAAGLEYEASILPQSILAQISVSNMRKHKKSWERANFASWEEAVAWIKTK
jgi:hypothetical protein